LYNYVKGYLKLVFKGPIFPRCKAPTNPLTFSFSFINHFLSHSFWLIGNDYITNSLSYTRPVTYLQHAQQIKITTPDLVPVTLLWHSCVLLVPRFICY